MKMSFPAGPNSDQTKSYDFGVNLLFFFFKIWLALVRRHQKRASQCEKHFTVTCIILCAVMLASLLQVLLLLLLLLLTGRTNQKISTRNESGLF